MLKTTKPYVFFFCAITKLNNGESYGYQIFYGYQSMFFYHNRFWKFWNFQFLLKCLVYNIWLMFNWTLFLSPVS